jgi:cytoskeletal protein RodZ
MSRQDPEETIAQARAQVEQAREELGETVEALAHKADVKGRAHDKADEVRARAESAAEQLRARAAPTAEQVRAKVAPAAEQVRAKVAPAAEQARAKAAPTALQVRDRVQEIPRPMLAGAVGAVLLAALVVRRVRARRRLY